MADDTTRRVRPGSRRPIGGGGWTERQTGGVPPQNGTDTLAALDLGTNSVPGVVPRVSTREAGFSFDVLEREKVVVRLWASGGDIPHLAAPAITPASPPTPPFSPRPPAP